MSNHKLSVWRTLIGCVVFIALSGCATTGEDIDENPDTLEGFNRAMFNVNDKLDKAILKPVAKGYKAITPAPIDDGISNFFSNLDDVVVVANDLLQFKFKQAGLDTTRVVFNTTFGLLGVLDTATIAGLPKHNEDFGQTLGYWGVGEGYFLVLPLLGPSTVRDAVGLGVDSYLHPLRYVESDEVQYTLIGINLVDTRADLLRTERAFTDAALDPYTFQREAYLQRRRHLVYDGNPPKPKLDFDENTE